MSKPKKTKAQRKADKWFKEMQRKRRAKKPKSPRIVVYRETPITLIGPSDCRITSGVSSVDVERPAHGSLEIGSPWEK